MFRFKDDGKSLENSRVQVKKAFSSNSSNGQSLNKTDFKCAWLYLFGYKISKFELQEYFEKLGRDYYTEGVNYEEFEKKAMSEIRRLDNIEEMRNAFITLDFSCKGFLTIEDLHKQFKLVAPHLSCATVNDIFRYETTSSLSNF